MNLRATTSPRRARTPLIPSSAPRLLHSSRVATATMAARPAACSHTLDPFCGARSFLELATGNSRGQMQGPGHAPAHLHLGDSASHSQPSSVHTAPTSSSLPCQQLPWLAPRGQHGHTGKRDRLRAPGAAQGLGRVAVAEKPAGHSLWQRGIWGRCQACARGASSRARLSPHQPEGLDSRATAPLQLRAPRCPREAWERVLGPKGDQSSPREARPGCLRTSEGAPACSQCARGGARQGPAHPPERHAHPGLAPPPQSPAQSRGSHAHPSPAPPPRACPARGLRDPRYLLGRRRSASARPSGALGAALR